MKLLAFLLPVAAALSAQSKERFAAYTEAHPEWRSSSQAERITHEAREAPSAWARSSSQAERIAHEAREAPASTDTERVHHDERTHEAREAPSAWAHSSSQAERITHEERAQAEPRSPWGVPRASPTAQAEHRSPWGAPRASPAAQAEHRSPWAGGRDSPTAGRPSWTASLPESEHHSHLDAVAKMAQYKAAHPERFERFGRADAEAPAPATEVSTAAALHNFSHTHTHNYSAAELVVFSAGMAHAKAVEGYKAAHPAEFTPAAVAAYKAAHPDRIAEASKLEAYTGADLDVFRAGFEHYDTVVAPYVAEHTEAFSGHKVAEYIFQHPTRFSFPLHG